VTQIVKAHDPNAGAAACRLELAGDAHGERHAAAALARLGRLELASNVRLANADALPEPVDIAPPQADELGLP
jgi:hypothetical protein